MKTPLLLLIFLLLLGLSNCTDTDTRFSKLTSSLITNKEKKIDESNKFSESTAKVNQMVRGFFILPDGTYSTSKDYVVPKLSSTFLEKIIDKLRTDGGGLIWLSYIDDKSKDNATLFLRVPSVKARMVSRPNFMASGAINFKKEKLKWENQNRTETLDSIKEAEQFQSKKQRFLDDAYSMLKNQVYVKSERNKLSDVSGSIESALKVLNDAKRNNVIQDCYLVGFSDFENDPDCPAIQLDPAIKAYNLISQPGKAKSVIPGSMEVTDVDYLLSIL